MQIIIKTEEDLKRLQGKFVIQIDEKAPDKRLMDFDWAFVKEKRLRMISKMGFMFNCQKKIQMLCFFVLYISVSLIEKL